MVMVKCTRVFLTLIKPVSLVRRYLLRRGGLFIRRESIQVCFTYQSAIISPLLVSLYHVLGLFY